MLLGSMLSWPSSPAALVQALTSATGGQPGYVAEAVRGMVRQGLLAAHRGPTGAIQWYDCSQGRVAVPGGVVRDVHRQRQRLDSLSNALLDAAALAGETSQLQLLAHATESSEAEAEARLDLLRRRGALSPPDGEGRWRFRVGLVAEVVRQDMPPEKRLELESRLAELLPQERASVDAARLLAAAGRADEAISEAVLCARQRPGACQLAGWLPELEQVVEQVARARATESGTLAQLYLAQARALASQQPHEAGADQAFALARAFAASGETRARLDLEQARLCRVRGEGLQERQLLRGALRRLAGLGKAALEAEALYELGSSAWYRGRLVQARGLYRQAILMARQTSAFAVVGRARVGHGVVLGALGRLEEAEDELVQAHRALIDAGDLENRYLAASNLTHLLRIQGRLSEALSLLEPSLASARVQTEPRTYTGMLLGIAEVEADLFRLGEARERLAEVDEMGIVDREPLIAARRAQVGARLALASGEPAEAVDLLADQVTMAERNELPVIALRLRGYLGRALADIGAREQGEEATRQAVEGLAEVGHLPALASACACRAHAMGEREDPEVCFGPAMPWLLEQPARMIRMEYLLAAAEHSATWGAGRQAYYQVCAARDLAVTIARQLSAADQRAFTIHPWHLRLQAVDEGRSFRGLRR